MPTQLPTRKLGRNGPEVTAAGFGAMGLYVLFYLLLLNILTKLRAGAYGPLLPDEERLAFLDQVYELGEWNWDSGKIAQRPHLPLYADNLLSGCLRRL
jgi:hypothetical protein